MTHRPEQVNAALHRAVQNVLTRGLNDPRITGLVSVTRVELSNDKRTATVFVSVLPAERSSAVLHGLRSAAMHIRMKLDESIEMRRVPLLEFELDDSLKKQAEVLAAIQRGVEREAAETGPESDKAESDSAANDSGAFGGRTPRSRNDEKDD